MIMINLYQTPPNMSSIGALCNSLGKTFLLLLVNNLGATGGLWLNSSPVMVKLIIFPLFLPKGNAILPITPKAVHGRWRGRCWPGGAAWGRECRRRSSVLPLNLSDTAATSQDGSSLKFIAPIAGRQCYI